MTLLWALACASSAGGFEAMIAVEGGAQQDRIVGGSQAICESHRRGPRRARVALWLAGRRRSSRTATSVSLHGPGGEVRARRAIVAMAPDLAGRIAYDAASRRPPRPAHEPDGLAAP